MWLQVKWKPFKLAVPSCNLDIHLTPFILSHTQERKKERKRERERGRQREREKKKERKRERERKKVKLLTRVQLFETPWTVAHQAPPSMGFSSQEYWSGLPFPSPGDLPDPGNEPRVSHTAGRGFNLWATRADYSYSLPGLPRCY